MTFFDYVRLQKKTRLTSCIVFHLKNYNDNSSERYGKHHKIYYLCALKTVTPNMPSVSSKINFDTFGCSNSSHDTNIIILVFHNRTFFYVQKKVEYITN
ncbi:hypothetical protein Hanom_Chr06g00478811 [Helianthus anomalus]